eukprot:13792221-Ditylum_brightwellii.AAC.1
MDKFWSCIPLLGMQWWQQWIQPSENLSFKMSCSYRQYAFQQPENLLRALNRQQEKQGTQMTR